MIKRIYNTSTGLFIRDDFDYDAEIESAYDGHIAGGFYLPKYVPDELGGSWVEGLSQVEIDALKVNTVPSEPSLEDRVQDNETKIASMEQVIDTIYGGV